jgi:hypothetical protein
MQGEIRGWKAFPTHASRFIPSWIPRYINRLHTALSICRFGPLKWDDNLHRELIDGERQWISLAGTIPWAKRSTRNTQPLENPRAIHKSPPYSQVATRLVAKRILRLSRKFRIHPAFFAPVSSTFRRHCCRIILLSIGLDFDALRRKIPL